MSSLSAQDRVSLCQFTFADGRRCRTPRTGKQSHFCFDHAQKEARARAAESLGKDLAYFFSGDYLSACDLSTALGRLIPAVIRGDVKPRNARTVAYMAQTLLQSIHISQHEYINAFGPDNWRDSIRKSVKGNYNHRFPSAPKPQPTASTAEPLNVAAGLQSGSVPATPHEQPAPPNPHPVPPPSQPVAPASPVCHPERSEGSHPIPATQPAPSPHTSLPPTAAEFAQQVLAGLVYPEPRRESGEPQAPQPAPAPSPQPAEPPSGCHSDAVAQAPCPEGTRRVRPEESAFSPSPSSSPVCHPERSEGSHPTPASHPRPPESTAQLDNPPPTRPSTPQRAPNRDPYAIHFDSLRVDGKPL